MQNSTHSLVSSHISWELLSSSSKWKHSAARWPLRANWWNSLPWKRCSLLPSSIQNLASISILRDHVACLGMCCQGKGNIFQVVQALNLVLHNSGDQYCPTRKTRHSALPWKQAACYSVSLEGVSHNLLAEYWPYGINTPNKMCSNALYSPAEDWDSAWHICKWRKMNVWALIRGQKGSGSQPLSTDTLQFHHYFFHCPTILTAYIFGFVESTILLLFPSQSRVMPHSERCKYWFDCDNCGVILCLKPCARAFIQSNLSMSWDI